MENKTIIIGVVAVAVVLLVFMNLSDNFRITGNVYKINDTVVIRDNLRVGKTTTTNKLTIKSLTGAGGMGGDYACLDEDGNLYRSKNSSC